MSVSLLRSSVSLVKNMLEKPNNKLKLKFWSFYKIAKNVRLYMKLLIRINFMSKIMS